MIKIFWKNFLRYKMEDSILYLQDNDTNLKNEASMLDIIVW